MNSFILSTASLLKREIIRFLRQRHRIVGALGTPLVFWLLMGSGLGKLQYFFPGTVVMILLFTAIFSTISIIEDRREGFLQGVLVSPAPRSSIAMGKILGGTILATGQGMVFLLLTPFLGIHLGFISFLHVLVMMLLVSFSLTGLGFIIAWRLDSTQGFHAIMNLFLMPMWFLSGALFPIAGAPKWLQVVMLLNPLTYGVAALQQAFFGGAAQAPSAFLCLSITAIFSLVMFALSVQATCKTDRPG